MVDLDLMRAVVAVWRTGSVSAAARQLGMTQSAMSSRLQSAEAAMGRPLFTRHARGVRATEACERLMRQVAPHVDAIEVQWSRARSRDDAASTVYLGGPSDFVSEQVMPHLAADHRLMVRFGVPDTLLPDVYAGHLDIVISTVSPRRPAAKVEPLFVETLLWVGHGECWREGRWLSWAEGLPLIRRYARATERPLPSPSVVVPDLRAMRSVLRAGVGMTVLPHYLVDPDMPVLERLETPVTNTLYTVIGRRRAGFASVRAVVDQLRTLRHGV